ncbi:MAG: cytochrome c oxidase assembly protein [Acidimicrobiales bacterium]
MTPPDLALFSWRHLNQWQISPIPTALLVLISAAYVVGVRRTTQPWPRARVVWFLAGAVVTFLATQSVIAVYDMSYFAMHMVQHLALIMVAAPLFALSAPLDLLYDQVAVLRRALDGPVMGVVTHPLFAFGLYFVFIPFTHLTSFFNLMLEHEWIHHGEEIGFLIVGYLFFRVAFGLERGVTLHPGLRLVYVMAGVPVDTFTGLALAMETYNPFPSYAAMAPAGVNRAWILNQVHLGGAIMWIGGDALMLVACVPIAVAWVRYETVRTRELDRELDAQGL